MAMVSTSKLNYQKLKHEIWFDEQEDDFDIRVIQRLRNSSRFRRLHIRRKLRVKIPSLKRFFKRKARLVKVAWNKVYKRLKEGQSHFGDLFAGNYMFMQVTPTPLKYGGKNGKFFVKTHELYSRYSMPRIS